MILISRIELARICHNLNREIQKLSGEQVDPTWNRAAPWMRDLSVYHVNTILDNPTITPEEMHNTWATALYVDGWTYGPERVEASKISPLIQFYVDLSIYEKLKYSLYFATVKANS